MNNVFCNIKKTPPTLTQQPDRSHFPATAARAKTGVPPRKTFSTPDFKQAKSVDPKSSRSDQGFVGMNAFRPFDAYPGSKSYGTKIKSGR